MNIAGAAIAVGIALAFISAVGAFVVFAWAIATLEMYGASRARGAFIALAFCLLGLIVGMGLIGAAVAWLNP